MMEAVCFIRSNLLGCLFVGFVLSIVPVALAGPRDAGSPWIAAWTSPAVFAAAPDYPVDVRSYENQTVRQTLRLGAAGTRLRIVLTNELGPTPIRVGSVHLALCDQTGKLLPGTDRAVNFSGKKDFTMPPGSPLYSDPVELEVPAFAEATISVFYPDRTAPSAHLAEVTISRPGDHTADPEFPEAKSARGPALASRVDVVPTLASQVIVAVGDSITEGPSSRPGHHLSWPDQLADRLAKTPGGARWCVVNAGIGGNRLLHGGSAEGPAALARFDRDVLDVPGVATVVLLEGINDIGFGAEPERASEKVSADDIVAADQQLIARAHAQGIHIYAATLTPYGGAAYYDAEGEKTRQAVNAFIRDGAFDGVVDFDAALRDPEHPQQLLSADSRPDHLHPSDAGFWFMAQTMPLP